MTYISCKANDIQLILLSNLIIYLWCSPSFYYLIKCSSSSKMLWTTDLRCSANNSNCNSKPCVGISFWKIGNPAWLIGSSQFLTATFKLQMIPKKWKKTLKCSNLNVNARWLQANKTVDQTPPPSPTPTPNQQRVFPKSFGYYITWSFDVHSEPIQFDIYRLT